MEVDPKLKSAVLKLKSGNNEDFGESVEVKSEKNENAVNEETSEGP